MKRILQAPIRDCHELIAEEFNRPHGITVFKKLLELIDQKDSEDRQELVTKYALLRKYRWIDHDERARELKNEIDKIAPERLILFKRVSDVKIKLL